MGQRIPNPGKGKDEMESQRGKEPAKDQPIAVGAEARSKEQPEQVLPVVQSELHIPQSIIEQYEASQRNSETREQARDTRDRRRLQMEAVALGIGILGIIALIVTLQETRRATEAALQSANVSLKQLEISERPWINADVTLSRAIAILDAGRTEIEIEVSVKNLGRSVATGVGVSAEVMLYSDKEVLPRTFSDYIRDFTEIKTRRAELCERTRWSGSPETGEFVLFPEQPVTIRTKIRLSQEDIEERAFNRLSEPNKLVDPVLIGCVTYKSTFVARGYVTSFIYDISSTARSDGHFRVGETLPVDAIKLEPYKHIDAYID